MAKEKTEKQKKPLTKEQKKSIGWEAFWLSLFGIIWVAGLAMGIIGVLAHNVGWNSRNPLYQAETDMTEWFGWGVRIDWRYFGVILLVVGMIGLVVTLYYFANKYEKAKQRSVRRAERLQAILAENAAVTSDAVAPGFISNDEKKSDNTGDAKGDNTQTQ